MVTEAKAIDQWPDMVETDLATTASHGPTTAGTATTPSKRKSGPNWATGSESRIFPPQR